MVNWTTTRVALGSGPRRRSPAGQWLCLVGVVAMLPLVPRPQPTEAAAPPWLAAPEPTRELEPINYKRSTTDLVGNASEVYSLKFSRDGKHLVIGSGGINRPGIVEVFDVSARKLLWRDTRSSGVSSVVYSHDGQRILSSGWGNVLVALEAKTGRGLATQLYSSRNTRLSASPDGQWIAAASEEGQLRLLNPSDATPVETLQGELVELYSVAFSPDSQLLAAGGGSNQSNRRDENRILLFDIKTKTQVARLEGHTRPILGLAFAPNNRLLASASADNTVRIWETTTPQLRFTLSGHVNPVQAVAFSPDGKQLASAGLDGQIKLWDPREGKLLKEIPANSGGLRDLAFSPDGKLLASGGAQRTVKLWDVETGKELTTLTRQLPPFDHPPVAMAASPTQPLLAIGTENGEIRLLDTRTGEVGQILRGHEDAVTTLTFSPDGQLLASSGPDSIIKLWNPSEGTLRRSLSGHESWVYTLAFSRDSRWLASGSYDRTIRVWPMAGGEGKRLDGHRASVRAVTFTPDGKQLISGSEDRTIHVWDLATKTSKTILKGHEGGIRGLAVLSDGKTLLSVGHDGRIKHWDLEQGKETRSVQASQPEQIQTVAVSPGGSSLTIGAAGGSVFLFDPQTLRQRLSEGSIHNQGTLAVCFGPGGQQLFSLGGDRSLRIWNGNLGPSRLLTGHKGPVRHAIYSPDGKWILSCGGWPEGDRTLKLWEAATGKHLRDIVRSDRQLMALAVTPDGKHAVIGGDGGLVQLWRLDGPQLVRSFVGHSETVPHLSLSPDGKHLATASHDRTIKVWNLQTGVLEQTLVGHEGAVRCVVFHPDGKRLISGSWDKTARVWNLETGKPLMRIPFANAKVERVVLVPGKEQLLLVGEAAPRLVHLERDGGLIQEFRPYKTTLTCVDVSSDGRHALFSGYAGTVQLWELASGGMLQELVDHRGTVWSAQFSPDGTKILTAGGGIWTLGFPNPGEDFGIRIWRMPSN